MVKGGGGVGSKEWFSVFCSSSQGLSNNLTFTMRF